MTSNFTCTGNNVDSYKILVKDSAGTVLSTIDKATGSYTFGFKIRVTNNGTEDLKNIVLDDENALACGWSVTLPNIKPNRFSGFKIGGKWDHSDSYLQPGEWFQYYCEEWNTTEDYTNTIAVKADGRDSWIDVFKEDPTDIKVVEAVCTGLEVDKTSGDVDFVSNFTCTGTNVNTYTIVVRDADGTVLTTINSNVGQYNFTEAWNYTASCYMDGEDTTASVCEKPIVATDPIVRDPEITLTKLDANNEGDSDGQVGNDTQTVVTWEKAVFRIIVENTGNEDLDTIVLSDENAANCAGSVTLPATIPDTFGNFTVSWAGNNNDAILQPGEKFEYTCEKANTTEAYTNLAKVNAESTVDNTPVASEDTTEVETGIYDLALVKKVINQKASYNQGDIVEFEIAVHNQWTIDATDVVVMDHVKNSQLILEDISWTRTAAGWDTPYRKYSRNIWNISDYWKIFC